MAAFSDNASDMSSLEARFAKGVTLESPQYKQPTGAGLEQSFTACKAQSVEKVVKRDYRGNEGVGYPLPTTLVFGKFDWKPLTSGHFPKTKAAAIASPVDTPPPYVSLFLLRPLSQQAQLYSL
ncbi:hypothetical protein QJ48_02060 [Paenibacillus sp. A3]|nr:hypothetical protein QJ48_02060 [Paenibacillus sp. A3]